VRYDRELLLGGVKRNAVLELWEVQRYGADSYADPDYVSIYGRRPTDWYAKGIRLLGRTAVECTRDELADAIGTDIAAVVGPSLRNDGLLVIDPFAGSGNTLYWMLHRLPRARGIGFELDDAVFELTSRNLSTLGLPIDVLHEDYSRGLASVARAGDERVIAFLAPPWGDALDKSTGLDLRRTTPPIGELVDVLIKRFTDGLLCAIQVYEHVDSVSLAEIETRFDWSELRIYDFNSPGENHGILLATKGWVP
jgi:hypothetical protein